MSASTASGKLASATNCSDPSLDTAGNHSPIDALVFDIYDHYQDAAVQTKAVWEPLTVEAFVQTEDSAQTGNGKNTDESKMNDKKGDGMNDNDGNTNVERDDGIETATEFCDILTVEEGLLP